MHRLFPAGRSLAGLVRPVLTRIGTIPIAEDRVFDATYRLHEQLEGVRELLTDPELTSVRLVVNPERMVIAEAQRMATYLSLFGYSVDAVIANRLLPDDVTDPWFKAWKEAHAEHLQSIKDGFSPLPVLEADLAGEEIEGVVALRKFGDHVYRDVDVAAVLHAEPPFTLDRRGDDLVLSIALPFVERDELDLGRRNGELIVRVGPHRRSVALPDSLRRRVVEGATMVGDRLEVTFAPAVAHAEHHPEETV